MSEAPPRPVVTIARSELRSRLTELLPALHARALVLCRQRSDADDLVQDTVVRALSFEASYLENTNLRAWLLQVLFSVFITRCRRSGRERRALDGLGRDPCSWAVPEQQATGPGLTQPVLVALDRLPVQFSKVVRLVDLEEQSYKDAAATLAVPVGTVMSRLFRGRRLLAQALGEARVPQAA